MHYKYTLLSAGIGAVLAAVFSPAANAQDDAAKSPKNLDRIQVTGSAIRSVDVGADKPLDRTVKEQAHLNPALGLRAIRWSLAER